MSLLSILRGKQKQQDVQPLKLATIATVSRVPTPIVAIVAKDADLKANNLTFTFNNDIDCTWRKQYFENTSRNKQQLEEEIILAESDFIKSRNQFHEHHWLCATCIAAGKGYGQRCVIGENLNTAYEVVFKEKYELGEMIAKLSRQSKIPSSLPYRVVVGKPSVTVINQPISAWSDHD